MNGLFKRASGGDRDAEKQLFLNLAVRFRAIIGLRISNSDDARDVIQDTLAVIAQKYKGLDEDINFIAWAHQVLKFQVLKHYKKTGSSKRKHQKLADEVSQSSGWEPDLILRDHLLQCLRKINKKNHLYARILNLHFQGFTTGEICNKLNITSNYCYVVLLRARSMIEYCLERGEV
ncbi:MAG: RNA polymerase sigma factor [Candidatus Zixiibacteriota bacterium]